MKEWVNKNIGLKAWGVFVVANIIAIWAWSAKGTDVSNLYRLFPLLGLIGFSTMWGHYVVAALRAWSGADTALTATYSKVTHWVVLAAILLHPTLLIYKLNADGLGLPPASYKAYVGESMVGFVYLGTLCLLVFLTFELKKWLVKKPGIWSVVMVANHAAMLGIVVHGARLGQDVKSAPLKYVWPFYGLSLIAIYIYLGIKKKLV